MNKIYLVVMLSAILAGCISKPPIDIVPPTPKVEPLTVVGWEQLAGWDSDKHLAALETFKRSCRAISKRKQWSYVCAEAQAIY